MVTCLGGARRGGTAPVAQAPPPRASASSAPGSRAPEPGSGAGALPVAPPPAGSAASPKPIGAHLPGLDRFHASLDELTQGRRKEPVRVLWMGDSHVAADFWPDAVRRPYQSRFGTGGPGFVYVGLGVYRHAGVQVTRDGKWHVRPRQPSLWLRQDDGVFGLGGIRVVPEEAKSSVTLELSPRAVRSGAHWDLAFRLPNDKARFRVTISGGESRTVDATTAEVGSMAHLEWDTPPSATVKVAEAAFEPEIFGVVIESRDPGLVVDTLGINGARVGTPLAWEPASWVAEAKRRRSSLVVLAYGTNEAGDQVAPWRYGPELEALVARARQAAPDADCLIVGPTDRAAPDWTTLPRVVDIEAVERQTADRVGCTFWSTIEAMGGVGSLKRWADRAPPLAAPDRVHLTPRGYGELGAAMASSMLGTTIVPGD